MSDNDVKVVVGDDGKSHVRIEVLDELTAIEADKLATTIREAAEKVRKANKPNTSWIGGKP